MCIVAISTPEKHHSKWPNKAVNLAECIEEDHSSADKEVCMSAPGDTGLGVLSG